jgi:RNA polymerase sigma-70 factor (ECF subfamily)
MADLLSLLAPDITWTTDSGGMVPAVRHLVMTDATQVASAFPALFREMRRRPDFCIEVASYNSQPAMAIHLGEFGESVCLLKISNGKIICGYTVRNPEKLAALAVPRTITRSGTPVP